ncbi:eCIS core domain-containing protein [Nostoc sp.]|uniref:eCIS core domain-containing protein n=1 Tax=Nostoc sp. TaxID=1180 RepID=UPI002FF355E9
MSDIYNGLRLRTFGQKKAATSTFSNPSLVSATTPTLANPVRGFGLPTNNVIQTVTDELINLQEVQTAGHNISSIALRRPQTKLTVGAPNDMYEQEADRVADQVMSMPDGKGSMQRETMPEEEEEIQTKTLGNSIQRETMLEEEEEIQTKTLAATIAPLVQREVMPEEEEEIQTKTLGNSIQREVMPEEEEELQTKTLGNGTLQREAMPEEEEEIQTKSFPDAGFQAESNLENRLSSSQGGGSALPDEVRSFMEPRFGADFSQVRVHTGGEAVQMNRELNAQAFTHKQDVYFGAGKAPGKDALTAHELTHVVQQTGNIQTSESLNQSSVQRKCPVCEEGQEVQIPQSPERERQDLQFKNTNTLTVQRLGESLKVKPNIKPASGTTKDGKQRQYSVEQYIEMWEAEQGRKLTDIEKQTLARGCIGITALDLSGGGNPPLDDCYATFDQAKAKIDKKNESLALQKDVALNLGMTELYDSFKDQRAVLFAKLFWSNQDSDEKKRKKPNKNAFRPDKKTGEVDMSEYKYLERPGFVNFDYGFWDEASQSFWHANHSQPGMKVYQSTKEKFAKGYIDFDRIVYCVAIAKNYDPAKAVKSP